MTKRISITPFTGMKISSVGVEVDSAQFDQYVFNSDYVTLRRWGQFSVLSGGFSSSQPSPDYVSLGKTFPDPPAFCSFRWMDSASSHTSGKVDPEGTEAQLLIYRGKTMSTDYGEDDKNYKQTNATQGGIVVTRTQMGFFNTNMADPVYAEVLVFDNTAGA